MNDFSQTNQILTDYKPWEKPPLDPKKDSILVILPVLNEIENIDTLLNKLRHQLAGLSYTICFIDDGSVDGTLARIDAAMVGTSDIHLIKRVKKVRHCQRGNALQAGWQWGLEHTNHTIFVEMDGDLSHRPEELLLGCEIIATGNWDIAIASKYLSGSDETNRSVGRKFVSHMSSIVFSLFISPKIRDYSNGYRFYTRSAAQLLTKHHFKYGSPIYLTEVLALWLKHDLRVMEFPSIYIGRNEGLSKLRWTDILIALLAISDISWRYHVAGFK